MMPRIPIQLGARFGKLVVTAEAPPKSGSICYECICDCGIVKVISGSALKRGNTSSCGCLRREVLKRSALKNVTHGMTKSATYKAWTSMHQRCGNSKRRDFHNYGGRGIRVCERWAHFENFLIDMGIRPSSRHSLDRYPDQNGNYEPENCRWATYTEQNANNRHARYLEFQGERLLVRHWAKKLGIKEDTLYNRLRMGWPVERVLGAPILR
jgi:hypothetical protein